MIINPPPIHFPPRAEVLCYQTYHCDWCTISCVHFSKGIEVQLNLPPARQLEAVGARAPLGYDCGVLQLGLVQDEEARAYSVVEDLPEDFGFTVTAGKTQASRDALTAYREMVAQDEEEGRRQIAERNAQTMRMRVRASR